MFITIAKTTSGRYVFAVGDNPNDGVRHCLHSFLDAAFMGDTPATFASFGEAHSYASRFIDDYPSSVMARKAMQLSDSDTGGEKGIAEGDFIEHYALTVKTITDRAEAAMGLESKEGKVELETISKELEGVMGQIQKLSEIAEEDGKKAFNMMIQCLDETKRKIEARNQHRTASAGVPTFNRVAKVAIRAFSEAAMLAITPSHPDVFVKGAVALGNGEYESMLSTPKGDVVRLAFDKHLLLSGVYPCHEAMSKCNGFHDERFLVGYFEPIVNAIGHFHHKTHGVVASVNAVHDKRGVMTGFGSHDKTASSLSVDRISVLGEKTWMIRKGLTMTAPPESPFQAGDEVECINETLPAYHGRTGSVVAVNKKPSMTLCRVDFRRGLGPVWLESSSVRKVNLGV